MKSVDVTELHYIVSNILDNAHSKDDVVFIEETLISYIKGLCSHKVESLEE